MGLRAYFGFGPRDAVEDRALTRETIPPSMLAPAPGGQTLTPDTALRTADVYACVRALVDAASSLPLHAYRRTDTGRVRVTDGVADLLAAPAPATTTAALIGQLMAHLQTHGNAWLGKFRDGSGRVAQLALLHPGRVTAEVKAGRPVYTVTGPKGERSTHGPDDIVHIRAALSIDGLHGLSPVGQCRTALGLSAALTEHAARFFENDARPSGVLRVPEMGPDDLRNMRDSLEVGHRGLENAHRVAVITGEASFEAISLPADDMQFIEQRRLSATETARVFRVPPWIVGAEDGSSMTYSNTEQQGLHFATYSLRPWLVAIEQAISADPDLCPGPLYVEFTMAGLLRADSKTRAEVYRLALDPLTGWMTREEVRRLENLDPEPTPPAPRAEQKETLRAA